MIALNLNLSAEVNRGIVQSEIEGGVYLPDLPLGSRLELDTEHHTWSIINLGEGRIRISGHPGLCPSAIDVTLFGSSWGGSLLKSAYLGRGMRMEFWHPSRDLVATSRILQIRQLA